MKRCRAEGAAGWRDRSARPHRLHRPTPAAKIERIGALRRRRWTGKQIAAELGVSPATVSRVLKRLGLNRLKALDPAEPVRRERPGRLIHIDIKRVGRFNRVGHGITGDRRGRSNGRGVGWKFFDVCIDDAARIAFSRIHPDEKKQSAVAFCKAAVACYRSVGIAVERVLTANGSCYRSSTFARACKRLALRHVRTRPYAPEPNGKAERFIPPCLCEGAYATAHPNSAERRNEPPRWLHRRNRHRPHGRSNADTPIHRLGPTQDNLSRLHS